MILHFENIWLPIKPVFVFSYYYFLKWIPHEVDLNFPKLQESCTFILIFRLILCCLTNHDLKILVNCAHSFSRWSNRNVGQLSWNSLIYFIKFEAFILHHIFFWVTWVKYSKENSIQHLLSLFRNYTVPMWIWSVRHQTNVMKKEITYVNEQKKW